METREKDDPELRQPLLRQGQAQANDGDEQQAPYTKAGLLGLATFSWVAPLLKVGSKRALESKDLPKLAPSESAAAVHQLMSRAWQANASSSYRLSRSLVSILWRNLAVASALQLVAMVCSYTGPYLMDDLVQSLGGAEGKSLVMLALILLLSRLVGGWAQSQGLIQGQIIELRSKSALTGLLYLKGLRLSSTSRQAHGSGDIVNYMAIDTAGVASCLEFIHHLWRLPLEVVLALLILYKSVGITAIATLVATVTTVAVNLPYTSMQDGYQAQIMKAKDVRMRATAECLRSMKILKLQAWEEAYLNKLEALRRIEYDWLRKISYNRAVSIFLFYISPAFVGIITFGTCILLKVPLTTGRVLSALATFRVLQAPLSSFPDTLSVLAQARVSLRRLSSFLLEEELQADAVSQLPRAGAGEFAVQVQGGAFSWDGSPEKLSLSNIHFHVWEGATVAVCGMVGSGKSTLLSCLLGQVPKLAGKVELHGKVAYVGQTAWIQSGKVQDNVLFGSPLDQSRYDKVLEMCQLKKDLEVLPYGDQTEIGERGINLSGGQKQRIQIARALYQDADIYLLDDPFSAVDIETGTHMFKEIILKALASKTVVLVTHQVEFLAVADSILVLKDGCITQQGTYQELLKSQADFNTLVHAHNKAMESVDQSSKSQQVLPAAADDNAAAGTMSPQPKQANQLQQLVKEEEREQGSIHLALYWSYCTAYSKGALIPLIAIGPLAFQVFQLAGNWWMAATSQLSVAAAKLIGVYVALTLGGSLLFLGRMVLIAIMGLGTSQIFFFNMLNHIFHAPMSFFDSTPAGRILSRASSDQSALDLDVPFRIGGLANSTTHFIFVVGVLSQSVWQVSVVFVPVAILCVKLQRYYMASARELARLQGTQKAPIIHHFSESLAGVATIRGFDQEERFAKHSLALIDDFSRPDFYSTGAMAWATLRLEFLTNIMFAVFLFTLVYLSGSVDPSLAGLAVTYGLNMDLPWVLWCLCTVEKVIISVERIQQYSCLPSEASWKVQATKPSESWPSDGTVELVDLQVRYTDTSPLVLHGITCKFPGGKKTGVVGRTGSGKSTLIQAIFRVIEPAGGRIIIDGVDISRLGLHDLRSRLSIIPQDPVLFEGTVRYNLDPLGRHSDAELWEALDKSEIGDLVRNKEGKLEASVSENGENWSVGQRQLLCLGRVMLKRARVLVLDEATASVDTATAAVLQSTISKEFTGCTVITIAHRLPTVIGSDLVLVLSDGRVVEYDEPAKLLDKGSSHFSKLVSEYSASKICST
ncbi:hypothetical protein SELMODRAFT_134840 [Selaginella moellendorffii]|uniref:Uncharacterized protein n=1 Tax=Selaginella moellendorffii TaxID=88036 RepID=D8T997_SELML|nr:ABC transporter C family member 13 [Selaginella moellendorffii]EFJ06788.1 hypothetical protein SELMODRAFT_134840 [Selaginella moellendorffii]|eukprot:XP_002992133.1 ABC transporter C family member 13 [Selaginella moellendorffii]